MIELDGGQHAERQKQNRLRTEFINARRFRVLRFWNSEVLTQTEAVLEAILDALMRELPHP